MRRYSHILLLLILLITALPSCSGLNEMWEGPASRGFYPKTVAILPISGAYDSAREDVEEVVAKVLMKSRKVEKVVPPEQVTDTFQATKDAFDALVTYFTRMETTGQSDKQSAVKIGQALNADSLLVVKVNAWEYTREEGDNIARVGLSMRLIDAINGAIVWKARHQVQESYLWMRPDMKDLATRLTSEMIKFMPPEKR
jgi:peptidoglycan-synthase activator LpoB